MNTSTSFGSLLTVALAVAAGAVIGWLALRSTYAARVAALAAERDVLRERVEDLAAAAIEDQRTAAALAPITSTLGRVEQQFTALEHDRSTQFGRLDSRLVEVGRSTALLQQETAQLTGALRSSNVAGAWGEAQLRRVLEHSGMLPRCDFDEQVAATTRHDRAVRPDVVVRLPGDKVLIIDSKAPMSHFLQAQGANVAPLERDQLLDAHATALSRHVDSLAAKDYWSAFTQSPEMVICFVPADAILSAALGANPDLLDRAMTKKVVLASPSTLLAMLRTTAFAWQQDSLTSNAQELLTLGTTLYERLSTLGRHTATLGNSLRKSVEAYNSMVGTMESRVLVTARQMQALGLAEHEIPQLSPVQAAARPLTTQELIDSLDADVSRPTLDFDLTDRDDRAQMSSERRDVG